MVHKESILQRQLVAWFRLQYPKLVLASVPNGGRRGLIEAKILKAEGALAGFADLILLKPNKEYHALFIEVKSEKGKQTQTQKDFEKYVTENGYCYVVVKTFDEFKSTIEEYLKKDNFCPQII